MMAILLNSQCQYFSSPKTSAALPPEGETVMELLSDQSRLLPSDVPGRHGEEHLRECHVGCHQEVNCQDPIQPRCRHLPERLSGRRIWKRRGRLCFALDSCLQHYAMTGEVYQLPLDVVRGTPGAGSPGATGEEQRPHTPKARTMLERTLKDAIHCQYVENVKRKPDQGKAFKVTFKWVSSNHFLPRGSFTNEGQNQLIMVNVTVAFENRTPAFRDAQARKVEKYSPLANTLRAKGYQVQTDALIIGALGTWDPSNE
ncbi:hypothetical protein UY3_07768 [Chelonia mydas]|uniref:Uncharacterized protein n=1 Tax=Chelonia mydas TaxID=8469 RepID=M7BHF4_CHEMY|nr:hypothetical protein UY3_07768 [Chelonia mydas]